MSRSFVTSSIHSPKAIVTALLLVACGGSSVVVGKTDTTDQTLQKTKDGGATGNGTTCSWANTSVYDTYGKPGTTPVPTYSVGDEFTSIDGCNECKCSDKGIMCTVKTCQPKACDDIAMICPDGKTSVGRTGPNCTFEPCPGDVACTDDAKKCPDGSFVGRTGPSCEFKPCGGGTDPGGACPALAKQCPDGSYVGATGPNCEFICPATDCAKIEETAASKLTATISSNLDCAIDSDCENVAVAADCVDHCAIPMAKSGEASLKLQIEQVNTAICQDYTKQGCKLIHPACAPSLPARCVDKKCQ